MCCFHYLHQIFILFAAPHTWDDKALDYPEDGNTIFICFNLSFDIPDTRANLLSIYEVESLIFDHFFSLSKWMHFERFFPLFRHALIWSLLNTIFHILGCYYQYQYYEEGEQIRTSEPCLNCTCHNQMLMCYLRVCPFIKPVGKNCVVEKRDDQCCPTIMCPQGNASKNQHF